MSKQLITVKEVSINNNCPECFSKEGLQLTFKQKFIETLFYKSITKEISTDMHCNLCETPIYPQRWTEDIERVYDYHYKAFVPKKSSTKLTPFSWILIGVSAVIIIAALALKMYLGASEKI